MSYVTRLDPLVYRQLVRWDLSDSLRVEAHLRLCERLPRSPTTLLVRDPSLFEGEGMTYRFDLIDPENRLVVHQFVFQVFYHADEQTLLVTRGGHATITGY